MKFYTTKDLLILLISLFIFQSCKKEGSIGLENQINESGLSGEFIDTSTIQIFTVKDDTLVSSNYVRNQVGEFVDPVFGTTNASVAFHATLSKNNVDFGTNPTLDSIILVMGYIGESSQRFYGDTNSVINLTVNQLDETISNDSVYYSNKNFLTKATSIGSINYRPNPTDSILLQNIRDNKPDTVIKVYQHVRIKLNDVFGQEILSKSGQADLSENSSFLNAYKGFYLKATKVSGAGGIMSFDLTNSNRSYIVLYYKNSTDTTNFIFNINSVAANINKYDHSYTGTVVQSQLNDSTLGDNTFYIQSLGGLRAKIKFPHLEKLIDSGLIAVNKAILIIPIETGSSDLFSPIGTLALKARRTDNTEFLISTASYNASKKQYSIELTKTVQQLIQNKLTFKELYIDDQSKQIRSNRSILNGPQNPIKPMKLEISYSKLY